MLFNPVINLFLCVIRVAVFFAGNLNSDVFIGCPCNNFFGAPVLLTVLVAFSANESALLDVVIPEIVFGVKPVVVGKPVIATLYEIATFVVLCEFKNVCGDNLYVTIPVNSGVVVSESDVSLCFIESVMVALNVDCLFVRSFDVSHYVLCEVDILRNTLSCFKCDSFNFNSLFHGLSVLSKVTRWVLLKLAMLYLLFDRAICPVSRWLRLCPPRQLHFSRCRNVRLHIRCHGV